MYLLRYWAESTSFCELISFLLLFCIFLLLLFFLFI